MGKRNSKLCCYSGGRRYPWNNFNLNSLLLQEIHLLPTSTKYQRVPSFEPDDVGTCLGEGEEEAVDLVLGSAVVPSGLPDVEHPGTAPDEREDLVGDETVVEDEVGGLDGSGGLHREEVRVSGAGPHQANSPQGAGPTILLLEELEEVLEVGETESDVVVVFLVVVVVVDPAVSVVSFLGVELSEGRGGGGGRRT